MTQSKSRFALRLPRAKRAADAIDPSVETPEMIELRLRGRTLPDPPAQAPAIEEASNGHAEIAWPMEQELRAVATTPVVGVAARSTVSSSAADDSATEGPVTDAPATASPPTQEPRPMTDSPTAHGSSFMEGMARAMRSAAEAERERSLATLRETAEAAVQAARGSGTARTAEVRRVVDEEVAAIRQWAKEEIGRIKDETAARVAARQERLAEDLEGVAAETARVIEQISEVVDAYEREFDAVFARLSAEHDPAAIARLAAAMPEPPQLPGFPVEPTAPPDGAVAPPQAEDVREMPDSAESPEQAGDPEALPNTQPGDGAEVAPGPHAEPQEQRSTAEAAAEGATAEVVAEAPLPSSEPEEGATGEVPTTFDVAAVGMRDTTLHLRGLTGIGAIAGYKWQLAALDGVEAAQVSSGEDGELVIRVQHVPDFALAEALGLLSGYATQVVRSEGSEVWATARETG